MKLRVVSTLCLLAALPCGAATTTVFLGGTGDGLWGTAGNWLYGSVPGAGENAVVNHGRVASVVADAPAVDWVTVGNNATPETTLNIAAELDVKHFRVAYAAGSSGHVRQTGGNLIIRTTFTIASVASGPGGGSYTIEGGSVDFADVTLLVGTQGPGLFTIAGSRPDAVGGSSMELGAQGTLRFELDTLGVSPLVLSGDMAIAGQIVVDGTNYEGFDGYFPLILSTGLTADVVDQVSFVGFGAREPAVVLQADGLWLRLVAPLALSERLCSLVPDSTVATDWSNTSFSATRAYDPSGSAWSLSLDEAHVLDTTLVQASLDSPVRSWELRTGRGGFIYSLRTPVLGETVPPSWRRTRDQSPWNDEVWQGVAVCQSLNNPPANPYFMHQSGGYLKDPVLREPFYSPQVASSLDEDERRFTTVNWTPQAHVNIYTDGNTDNDFKSYLLMYTSYRDLGQGVIEVSLGYYNYGPDVLGWLNMPWGGVRRTSMEYAFVADGVDWFGPVTDTWGTVVDFNATGGWLGYSASANGTTPALGFVYGQDTESLLPDQTRKSWIRWGYAGGTFSTNETNWRNYFVTSVVRHYALTQGKGLWSRFYFVLGDNLQDLSQRIADRELVDAELRPFNYTEASTPLVAYSVSGSGVDFRVTANSPAAQFFLYAHPVSGSFPVFEVIENDSSRYLTWNPYANGIVKPYDGTVAGMRLLGFAMPGAGTAGSSAPLSSFLPAENYIADGETLQVRTATAVESWRVEHFGLTGNTGDAANLANPDHDAANNLVEFALGGNPMDDADTGEIPEYHLREEGEAKFFEYVYARRRDAAAQGLSYQVQVVSDLLSGSWSHRGVSETGTAVIDDTFEAVTNRIAADAAAGFVRLEIELSE